MTLIEVAQIIGDVLTDIDTTLQTPGLNDADWQTLYALRKHLDDLQRELIGESINEGDAAYQSLSAQLKTANTELSGVMGDLSKVSKVIGMVSEIASYADKMLGLVK